jgi:FixJ family two-component response regulator
MSGRELVELLHPLFPDMQILFMSGYTDDAVLRHGIVEADVAFIQKPFSAVDLAVKVRRVLDSGPCGTPSRRSGLNSPA